MGTTPVYGFPYPEPVDAADGPFALEELALAVEAEVARIWTDAEDVEYLMQQRPMLRQRRNAVFSVPNAADTAIPFDTTDVNTLGAVRPAAWYLVTWGVGFDPNAAGYRGSTFKVNGVAHPAGASDPPPLASAAYITMCKGRLLLVFLNPADTLTVSCFQNSGVALQIRTAPTADQAHLTVIHVAGPLPSGFPP
jgi:hypothetical protein